MVQSADQEYLLALQAQVASLRRKLVEERAEQDRAESLTKKAQREAELLRPQVQELEAALIEKRDHLVELSQEAIHGRLEAEASKKEVIDRQLQITWLESELLQAKEKADKKVSEGSQCGKEAIERQEGAQLDLIATRSATLQAHADEAEAEVLRLQAELNAYVQEAARQLRCSAAVQLRAALECCTHRSRAAEQQERYDEVAAELAQQREELLCRRDNQLEDTEKETRSRRKAIAEQRKIEERKMARKKKALLAKVVAARHESEQLDHDVVEQATERRRQEARAAAKRSAALAAAKVDAAAAMLSHEARHSSLAKALSKQASVLQPMMLANARGPSGSKAGGLHAEFPLLGALQEIDQEISRATVASCAHGIDSVSA